MPCNAPPGAAAALPRRVERLRRATPAHSCAIRRRAPRCGRDRPRSKRPATSSPAAMARLASAIVNWVGSIARLSPRVDENMRGLRRPVARPPHDSAACAGQSGAPAATPRTAPGSASAPPARPAPESARLKASRRPSLPPISAACARGAARKFFGRPALAIAPYWTTSGKAACDEFAHRDEPVEVDAGLEAHRSRA